LFVEFGFQSVTAGDFVPHHVAKTLQVGVNFGVDFFERRLRAALFGAKRR